MPPRQSLEGAVTLVSALLESAFATFVTRLVAHQRKRRSPAADRDLARLLDDVIPDVLLEHEGVDGRLVWCLARAQAERRRHVVLSEVLGAQDACDLPFDSERLWRRFSLRLALSPAGLDWGLVPCGLTSPTTSSRGIACARSVESKKKSTP